MHKHKCFNVGWSGYSNNEGVWCAAVQIGNLFEMGKKKLTKKLTTSLDEGLELLADLPKWSNLENSYKEAAIKKVETDLKKVGPADLKTYIDGHEARKSIFMAALENATKGPDSLDICVDRANVLLAALAGKYPLSLSSIDENRLIIAIINCESGVGAPRGLDLI
jgi:hypothetical protein